jgi:putative transposase
VEGIIHRYRCGIAWRDVPAVFGPWQTIWTWHRRMAGNGTWDTVLQRLLSTADAAGEIDWAVSVDSTISAASRGRCLGGRGPGLSLGGLSDGRAESPESDPELGTH